MDLSTLPRERIMGETEKALLKAKKPSIFFEKMREMDQLETWFPELMALIGVEQNPRYHSEGDVWVHTMMVIDKAAELKEYSSNPLGFMLSAVAHDFGKAVSTEVIDGVIHAYGHEVKGLPLVKKFIERLSGEVALTKYLLNMTELHMKPNVLAAVNAPIKSSNKMLDSAIDPEGLICLVIADSLGKTSPLEYISYNDYFKERIAIYRQYMSRPYVMGQDLIEAGLKPSKEFSDYLAYAHKLRLAGVDKESAMKQTLAYAKKGKK
jgi:tRNA nucleotidyltransferase (CCA-adding enzyme)